MTPRSNVALACRVLFVDDDPFYRDLAETALSSAGMVHAVAENGDDANTLLASAPFDLMVLDLSMPGRSGFEVLEDVRSIERFAELPVIVVTGDGDETTVARAFELGATSFMVKPLNWPLFVQHIRYVHQSAQARADLRRAQRTAEFMIDLKSRLIGTLVTEFQAPLRSAYNFSRLVNQEADGPIGSPLYSEWMQELHRSLERMSAVHLKMLNFGRSLSDEIQLNEHSVDIAQLVSAAVEQHRLAARRRNITLAFDDALSGPTSATVDGVLLAHAIAGIIDNCVKFSSRGAEVSIRLGLSGANQLTITIDDAVPSMTQAQIDEIMGTKTFTTVRPETVQSCTALKMSRILIEAHQGQMRMRASARGMTTAIVLAKERAVSRTETRQTEPARTSMPRPALKRTA
jgi:two-component system, sensor histidine kinase and response regulator